MATWTVASVCSKMKDCAALLEARKSSNDQKLNSKLLAALQFKITSLHHVTAADALVLHSTLAECNFQEPLAAKIAEVIDEILGKQQEELATQQILKPQTLWNIQLFLTASEWKIMDGSDPWSAKEQMLVARLKKLGIRSMTEKTVRASVALLFSTVPTLPDDAATLYQKVVDFKQCFHTAADAAAHVPYIVNFPEQPSGLPQQLLGHAYTQDDPPVPREVPGFGQLKAAMILRNSHKSIRGLKVGKHTAQQITTATPAAAAPAFSSARSSMGSGGNMGDFYGNPMMQMTGTMFNAFANFAGMQGNPNQGNVLAQSFAQDARQFQPKNNKASIPLQLKDLEMQDEKKEADKAEDTAKQPDSAMLPLGPMEAEGMEAEPMSTELGEADEKAKPAVEQPTVEQKLFDALKQKQQNKAQASKSNTAKQQAAGKSKSNCKGKSKAAAKPKGKVLKRPAAFSPGLPKYEPPAPTAAQLDSQKVCFVDMHYHKAKKIARQAGLSDEEACLYARAARSRAGEQWDAALQ